MLKPGTSCKLWSIAILGQKPSRNIFLEPRSSLYSLSWAGLPDPKWQDSSSSEHWGSWAWGDDDGALGFWMWTEEEASWPPDGPKPDIMIIVQCAFLVIVIMKSISLITIFKNFDFYLSNNLSITFQWCCICFMLCSKDVLVFFRHSVYDGKWFCE